MGSFWYCSGMVETVTRVTATFHGDSYLFPFDVTTQMAALTNHQVTTLRYADWGYCDEATQFAVNASGNNPTIELALNLLNEQNLLRESDGLPLAEFEVQLNLREAEAWLAAH